MVKATGCEAKRGAIHSEQAYAQGKMLDNSKWDLPRRITPSDVDLCFDDGGDVLVCELSRRHRDWMGISVGQRTLYKRIVFNGCGRIVAALCKHSVHRTRQIDTRNDVDSYQLLLYKAGEMFTSDVMFDWAHFVERTFYRTRDGFHQFAIHPFP